MNSEAAPDLEELARASISIVKQIAFQFHRRCPSWVDVSDLIGPGLEGLSDALCKFDPSRYFKFKTYAEYRIRGAILDYLRDLDFISRGAREKLKTVAAMTEFLRRELGREPTRQEIRHELWLSIEELDEILENDGAGIVSVEHTDAEANDECARVEHEEESAPQFRAIAQREASSLVNSLLARLDERRAYCLRQYFIEDESMREIAESLGITESRVSQLISQGLSLLRARSRERALFFEIGGLYVDR